MESLPAEESSAYKPNSSRKKESIKSEVKPQFLSIDASKNIFQSSPTNADHFTSI